MIKPHYLSTLFTPVLVSAVMACSAAAHATELETLDAFHPPVGGDLNSLLYKELHSFTLHSKRQNIFFNTVQTLEGDVTNPALSYAVDVQNYSTPGKSDLTASPFPVFAAEWSATSPSVRIGPSSTVYDDGVYHLTTKSPDATTILQATFTPTAGPEEIVSMTGLPEGASVNWLVSAPRMLVNGNLTVNQGLEDEELYQLRNVSGYHDHIWGAWDWNMDLGWSYGHGLQGPCIPSKKSWQCKKGKTTYTISLLNLTNNTDSATYSTLINLWEGNAKLASFTEAQIHTEKEMIPVDGMPGIEVPAVSTMNASNGADSVRIVFTTEDFAPIYLPINGGYRLLWQLSGNFKVKGMVNGQKVRFSADGNIEYLAEPLLIP